MPAFFPTHRAKPAIDNAVSMNRSTNLEKECEALRTEWTLAQSKLDEMESAFSERDLQSTPLAVFQQLSSKISQQRLIIDRLRQQYAEKELELGQQRSRDAEAWGHQQTLTRYHEVIEAVSQKDALLQKSQLLRQQMQQQELILAGEKNNLLLELSQLKMQLGDTGVN